MQSFQVLKTEPETMLHYLLLGYRALLKAIFLKDAIKMDET